MVELKGLGHSNPGMAFPGPDGNQMDANAMYKQWQHYRDQHGIKPTLHELRHTTVSLVKTELPEDLLKQMIGHSLTAWTRGDTSTKSKATWKRQQKSWRAFSLKFCNRVLLCVLCI